MNALCNSYLGTQQKLNFYHWYLDVYYKYNCSIETFQAGYWSASALLLVAKDILQQSSFLVINIYAYILRCTMVAGLDVIIILKGYQTDGCASFTISRRYEFNVRTFCI